MLSGLSSPGTSSVIASPFEVGLISFAPGGVDGEEVSSMLVSRKVLSRKKSYEADDMVEEHVYIHSRTKDNRYKRLSCVSCGS